MFPHKNKKTGFWLRKARSYPYIVIFKPLKISSLVVEYLPRTWFFYMIFWYFFLLLLWSSIWHQLFLLLATFVFGSMEKSTTCVTPGIRDFGHWSWKVSHDAHNLQPFDGLIKKKTKAVAISHLGTTMWLTIYFDRIDVSEGTDINKASASKERDICQYWYFLNYSFRF